MILGSSICNQGLAEVGRKPCHTRCTDLGAFVRDHLCYVQPVFATQDGHT